MHVAMDRCCPCCSGVVVVQGDDTEGTHYYWCVTCQKAVDPVRDDEEDDGEHRPEFYSDDWRPEFQGSASELAWVFAVGWWQS